MWGERKDSIPMEDAIQIESTPMEDVCPLHCLSIFSYRWSLMTNVLPADDYQLEAIVKAPAPSCRPLAQKEDVSESQGSAVPHINWMTLAAFGLCTRSHLDVAFRCKVATVTRTPTPLHCQPDERPCSVNSCAPRPRLGRKDIRRRTSSNNFGGR